ncbi:Hypothetical predicted protein [Olea europaea subsp. europaea]|uniref:Uncharacterized protein n=1 Tax=Olea europaea subsp. europaea TaxID=158383 RepID=A0A8S0RC80_OLEEU|nr:Hypothetical predicted protein [Olea europaea subsp. europaea]
MRRRLVAAQRLVPQDGQQCAAGTHKGPRGRAPEQMGRPHARLRESSKTARAARSLLFRRARVRARPSRVTSAARTDRRALISRALFGVGGTSFVVVVWLGVWPGIGALGRVAHRRRGPCAAGRESESAPGQSITRRARFARSPRSLARSLAIQSEPRLGRRERCLREPAVLSKCFARNILSALAELAWDSRRDPHRGLSSGRDRERAGPAEGRPKTLNGNRATFAGGRGATRFRAALRGARGERRAAAHAKSGSDFRLRSFVFHSNARLCKHAERTSRAPVCLAAAPRDRRDRASERGERERERAERRRAIKIRVSKWSARESQLAARSLRSLRGPKVESGNRSPLITAERGRL